MDVKEAIPKSIATVMKDTYVIEYEKFIYLNSKEMKYK